MILVSEDRIRAMLSVSAKYKTETFMMCRSLIGQQPVNCPKGTFK